MRLLFYVDGSNHAISNFVIVEVRLFVFTNIRRSGMLNKVYKNPLHVGEDMFHGFH